jgi:hypothetical protein
MRTKCKEVTLHKDRLLVEMVVECYTCVATTMSSS